MGAGRVVRPAHGRGGRARAAGAARRDRGTHHRQPVAAEHAARGQPPARVHRHAGAAAAAAAAADDAHARRAADDVGLPEGRRGGAGGAGAAALAGRADAQRQARARGAARAAAPGAYRRRGGGHQAARHRQEP